MPFQIVIARKLKCNDQKGRIFNVISLAFKCQMTTNRLKGVVVVVAAPATHRSDVSIYILRGRQHRNGKKS